MSKLRVCHFPQVPCKPFIVEIHTLEEALLLFDVLANYDLFQYHNRIKPDYCNATVLEMWEEDSDGEGNPGWCNWYDKEGNEIGDYKLIDGKVVLDV